MPLWGRETDWANWFLAHEIHPRGGRDCEDPFEGWGLGPFPPVRGAGEWACPKRTLGVGPEGAEWACPSGREEEWVGLKQRVGPQAARRPVAARVGPAPAGWWERKAPRGALLDEAAAPSLHWT